MALDGPSRIDHPRSHLLEASETVASGSVTTTATTTTILEASGFTDRTFFVKNTTDVTVTVQLQGSPNQDFTEAFDVGASEDLGVGNTTPTRTAIANNDAIRYLRVQLTGSGSATTGQVDVWVYAEGQAT